MKTTLLALCLLFLTGCVSAPSGQGSRLAPWNWFSPDSSAKIERQVERRDVARDDLRTAAQQFIEGARLAIDAERARLATGGGASTELDTAATLTKRAGDSLNKSEGALDPATLRAAEVLVAQLTSELDVERKAGAKTLRSWDADTQSAARQLNAAADRIGDLEKISAAEKQRALAAETKLNRWKFWAFCLIGGWLFLQILPMLSVLFPAIAPAARVAGMIVAPAVQAGYNRTRDAAGAAIRAVEKISITAANAARVALDGPLTVADQEEVAKAYKLAHVPPEPPAP